MTFRILLLLSATALGGCGLVAPAISIASFAADAFSYAVSGKSVSDHGLSMVMQEDCAVLNFVKGEAICAPGPHPEIEMATPRDPEAERTLIASARAQPDTDPVAESPIWTPPAPVALSMQYAAAGPLLDQPALPPAIILLEPVASGPVDVLASVDAPKPPV